MCVHARLYRAFHHILYPHSYHLLPLLLPLSMGEDRISFPFIIIKTSCSGQKML